MPRATVHIDAARTQRSLVAAADSVKRPQLKAEPTLKFWRWLINSAVADSKRVYAGLPTDAAILGRWWIEEHRPLQSQRLEWERCFECACTWLDLDPMKERVSLLHEIDRHLEQAYRDHVRTTVYQRRAAVLTAAGIPTAIARQNLLPLISEHDYEHVAGIEHGDPPKVAAKLASLTAA